MRTSAGETPAATPGETPAATPGETPAATPGETLAATPGETPAATPGETPAATAGAATPVPEDAPKRRACFTAGLYFGVVHTAALPPDVALAKIVCIISSGWWQ